MASSGLRIGALPSLKIRNLEKIDNLYKITVYEGSNSQYITFTSPECSAYIDAYLDFRTINGENLNKDSYLIREQFDISDLEQIASKSKGMTISGINSFLNILLLKSGVRTIKHTKGRRDVARAHGFRKFFTTQCVNAKLNPEIREMLLGHKIGLTSCYYRPTEQEMLNEYLKAIDNTVDSDKPVGLTIDPANRLKFKLEQKIQIEKSQLETLKADFEKFKLEVLKQRSKKT